MPVGSLPRPLDDTQFTAFLQRALPTVRTFLQRLAPSSTDAEDVLQETMAKVWRLRRGFDPQQNGQGWLLQAAFRTFCDHRRWRRREPATSTDVADQPAPKRPCPTELQDEVRHRLLALTPIERALLLGFHAEGCSLQELAERHTLPINTVKSHLHRARRRLQEEDR